MSVFIICLALFFPSPVTGHEETIPSRYSHDNENTVVIIRSQQIVAYNEAIECFEQACRTNKISVKAIYDLNGNISIEDGKRIVQSIKDNKDKPDLILAVGILAAVLAKEYWSDIPIIFCMAINYEDLNLNGTNISGISSEVSIEDQFAVLKEFTSVKKLKNVGVVYDPGNTENIVSKATLIAERFGFNLIKTEVTSEKQVGPAIVSIVKKIDALWIISDETVITKNALNILLKETERHHLLTLCTSGAVVKAGALISVSPDYAYTGIQAAKMAQILLNDPQKMSLGIQQPEKLKLILNTQTAEKLGIDPSFFKFRDIILYP